jgi:HEAT repeat protein
MSLRTADTSRQEVQVPRYQDKKIRVMRTAPCLLMLLAVSLLSVTEAGAQADASRQSDPGAGVKAAAAARRHLERALASDNGNVRWDALREARSLNEPWIAEIVHPLCDSPDIIERVIALEVVANTDPRLCKAAFLDVLTSGERSLRLRGLLGLGALGDGDTVTDLVEIMKDDPDPDLRVEAARALGDIGDARASIPLYEAMESPFPPVREQAVIALMAIGDEGVVEYLVGRLRDDDDPGEREILRLLALIPDPSLVGLIEPFLEHDDTDVRTLAAVAIFSILERSGATQP